MAFSKPLTGAVSSAVFPVSYLHARNLSNISVAACRNENGQDWVKAVILGCSACKIIQKSKFRGAPLNVRMKVSIAY